MDNSHYKKPLVILLHEIYGVNEQIKYFFNRFIDEGFDVLAPDLLQKEPFPYEQEEDAYRYFMNQIGFNKSVNKVAQLIQLNRDKYDQVYVVGFSVGATIAWLSSEYKVDGIVGFYGSRIRDYSEIVPGCPALLYFAIKEKSFDVYDLEKKIRIKSNVSVNVVDAEHGFMNPFIKTYDSQKSTECLRDAIVFLKRIREGTGIT